MVTNPKVKQSKESIMNQMTREIYEYYRDHKNECDNQYQIAMDKNIASIYEKLEGSLERELVKVAIVILTANKFEKNILHQYVKARTNAVIKEAEITLFDHPEKHNVTNGYFFELEGYNILHIACQVTGSYTIGGCADAVRYCIKSPYIFPTAFISFGICFGCKENKNHLCDTIISNKVYPYFIGVKINDEELSASDDYVLSTSSEMESKINQYFEKNILPIDAKEFNVEFGNYITGEAVVSNRLAREAFIRTTKQPIIAGDMEAYGLFKECNNAYRNIPCTVIKSICDWGILKNVDDAEIYKEIFGEQSDEKEAKFVKDKLQAFAAYHSFLVLETLLKGIQNGKGQIEKPFEVSIYKRICNKVKNETNENTWYKQSLEEEAKRLYKEVKNTIASDYINTFCKNLENEFLLEDKGNRISRKNKVKKEGK